MDVPVRDLCILRSDRVFANAVFPESLPDLTPMLKPSTLGDVATYFFASLGGLFLGGELGTKLADLRSLD